MKLNEKYEVSPFGNAFDSLFSLLTRGGPFTNEIHPSETIGSTHYGPVRYKDEGTQTRIEFLLPGWKKSDLSLSLEGNQLKLSGKKTKGKEADGLFQANDLTKGRNSENRQGGQTIKDRNRLADQKRLLRIIQARMETGARSRGRTGTT